MRVQVVAVLATVVVGATACSSGHPPARRSAAPTVTSPTATSPTVTAPAVGASPTTSAISPAAGPTRTPSSTHPTSASTARRTTSRPPRPAPTVARTPPSALPLHLTTGDATQVVTVVASSSSSTTAVLQAWTRTGRGWTRYGPSVPAHLGSDGLSTHPSESRSATPVGSFTLTQAFGRDADPGTALPYLHTTPADWWISEAGPLYNTHQRCSSGCGFDTSGNPDANPNEHLYYETPFYDYAVVIDYNTRDAPGGVHPGAGSAFFLHVTDGNPTAGCVSIPVGSLVSIMKWLEPGRHPRILIGVT